MNIRKAICSALAALLITAAPSAFATGGGNPSASPEQTATPPVSVSATREPISWPSPEPSPEPSVSPTPIPSPTPGELEITKSPENENVKPGGTASFITQAVNYTSCKWYLSKDGETVEADRAEERFPGLKVAGDGTEKLILSAIPKSLDGWSVYCVFKGAAGSVSTARRVFTYPIQPSQSLRGYLRQLLPRVPSLPPSPQQSRCRLPRLTYIPSPPSGKATTPGTGRNVNAVRRSILQIM